MRYNESVLEIGEDEYYSGKYADRETPNEFEVDVDFTYKSVDRDKLGSWHDPIIVVEFERCFYNNFKYCHWIIEDVFLLLRELLYTMSMFTGSKVWRVLICKGNTGFDSEDFSVKLSKMMGGTFHATEKGRYFEGFFAFVNDAEICQRSWLKNMIIKESICQEEM